MNDSAKDIAAAGRFGDAVVALIRERDHVSFVEIESLLRPHMTVTGNQSIEFPGNVVVWITSDEVVSVLLPLLKERRVFLHASSPLAYLIDGRVLTLPVAKSARPYKAKRWAPCCLRLVPLVEDKRRKKAGVS